MIRDYGIQFTVPMLPPVLLPGSWRELLAFDDRPGHEAFPGREEGARATVHAVREDDDLVVGEEGRDLLLAGLDLVEGLMGIRVFVSRVLELDHHQRQAVDK